MDNQLENFGNSVNGHLTKEYGFDPMTMLMILSILIQVGKLLGQCGYSDLSNKMRYRPLFCKLWLRKHLNQICDESGYDKVDEFCHALMSEARNLSQEELNNLVGKTL